MAKDVLQDQPSCVSQEVSYLVSWPPPSPCERLLRLSPGLSPELQPIAPLTPSQATSSSKRVPLLTPLFVKAQGWQFINKFETLESSFTSGLDFIGVFHSVAGMLQGKQDCAYSIKDRSPVVRNPANFKLTWLRVLFLCNVYCVSLELVPGRTRFRNVDVYFIYVCLEAISSEAEAAMLLSSKVVFTW